MKRKIFVFSQFFFFFFVLTLLAQQTSNQLSQSSSPALFYSVKKPVELIYPKQLSVNRQKTWTLEEVIQRALDANPEVVAARKAIEQQEGIKMQFKAKLYPHGGLVYRAQREQSSLLMFLPTIEAYPLTRTSWLGAVQIKQTILNVESVKLARQQKELVEKAIWQAMDMALKTTAQVKEAFYLTLFRQEVVDIREELTEASKAIADYTMKMYKAGELPQYQALSAQAEYSTAQGDLAQARYQYVKAREQLRMILNLPSGSENDPLYLSGESKIVPFDVPYEEALKIALQKRTDLNAALHGLYAAHAAVAAAQASYYPNLDALLQYENISNVYILYPKWGWTAGVQGQWNFFDIMENNGKIKAQKALEDIAQVKVTQLKVDIPAELRELYQQLKRSKESFAFQENAVNDAEKGFYQARRLFESGETNWVQAVLARQALLKAKIGYAEAKYNYNAALARLEYAVGGQLPRE
ncbi:TolC family protein [Methylacidiphilum kamchatkense]|uniref:Outer membrane protein TolC n=2 Tax=Methylacidiphilum kamchatkense Kam1 TaxID=1202785 RepID=A0A516TNU4_9BACT|nr:TolC family protein [Methylacidiphilum kamchatkense]QDQ42906.1 outer membrane protein TolC [Methylacidiphilum kamchatkense Kam1]